MADDAPRLSSLERALSAEPILSPVLEIEVNGRQTCVRFKELSQTQIDRLRMSAIQWVEDHRRQLERGEDGEWRDAQLDLDALRANRLDILMLCESLVDAESNRPALSKTEWAEQRMSPDLQEFLAQKWNEFKASIDPDDVNSELVQALIEELKKKRELMAPADLGVWLWTQFGYKRLVGCLLYLVDRLSNSPDGFYSLTSSGEMPPPPPPPESS